MITIARYSFPHEAQIARAKLESEGIPVFVADEHTVSVNWLLSSAVGGVRVQVPREYVAKATYILERDDSAAVEADLDRIIEDAEDSGAEAGPDWQEPPTPCPVCGGETEQVMRGRKPAFLSWLLLGFPLGRLRRKRQCKACHRQFDVPPHGST